MFWGGYPGETDNQFEFNLFVYPDQHSFATPGSFCEAGDRYTTPSDEERLDVCDASFSGKSVERSLT
jgi:hypothetical protein